MKLIAVLVLCVILSLVIYVSLPSKITHEPGQLIESAPTQDNLTSANSIPQVTIGQYIITPLTTYSGSVLILGVEDYYFGDDVDLMPRDYIFSWGKLTNQDLIDKVEFDQGGRWYRYTIPNENLSYISNDDVGLNSANTHVIPADSFIAEKMSGIAPGDIIKFNGYLVSVFDKKSGWTMSSSLSRDDTRGGACEVVYITDVEITTNKYF